MTTNYRKNKETGKLEGSWASPVSPPPTPDIPVTNTSSDTPAVTADMYAGIAEAFATKTGANLITLETRRCMSCHETGTVTVDKTQLEAYNAGAFIQDAFPDLSPGEREQLLTGTHSECWDKMFSYMEDYEDGEEYDDGIDGAGEAEALSS